MRLSFVAVVSDQQFRDLLHVRNECRGGLTHDTHELTLQDQKAWKSMCWPHTEIIAGESTWPPFGVPSNTWYEPYLLYDNEWPIGYGLLKWDGKRYWMTAGIVGEYRGKGLSRVLISFITEMAYREKMGVEIWLDAKDDNLGMFGYVREGYEFPEVWIDVLDKNPALFSDIRVGYEFVEKNAAKHDRIDLHVMKHNRDRRLRPQEAQWMKEHGKPVAEYDIVEEMIEVDAISRETLT